MAPHIPKVEILQIFVRNRTLGGWPREKIVAAIKTRIRWDQIDVDALDDAGRERYAAVAALLEGLEI